MSSGGANAIPPDSDLKQALCTYGPLAVAVKADQLTWMGNAGDVIQDFTNDPNASVNHAILLVGWDDSKQRVDFQELVGTVGDPGFGLRLCGIRLQQHRLGCCMGDCCPKLERNRYTPLGKRFSSGPLCEPSDSVRTAGPSIEPGPSNYLRKYELPASNAPPIGWCPRLIERVT